MVLATRSKTSKENKPNSEVIQSVKVIKKSGKVKEQNNNESSEVKAKSKRRMSSKDEIKCKISKTNEKEDEKCTLFCKNLSFSVTEDDLTTFFEKSTGARIIVNRKGLSKGYGFVDFNSEKELQEALDAKNLELHGRIMELKRSVKDFKTEKANDKFSEDTLFLKGKCEEVTKEFFNYEGITEVRVMKGFCYIEFESKEMAEKVFRATRNGLNIDGKVFEVDYALKRATGRKRTFSKNETEDDQ